MVTTTSNVMTFDQSFYQAMNDRAAQFIREDPQVNWIHQAPVTPLDAPEYKKPIYGNSIGVTGETKLGLPEIVMTTPKSHNAYPLNYVRGNIYYTVNDMMTEGRYLVQQKAQELATWLNQVKQAAFKGVRTGVPTAASPYPTMYTEAGVGQGSVLNTGIIEQSTLVENLDGTDSALAAAGDVYKALSKMVNSIPFRFRDGKRVVIGCDDLFVSKARGALYRGATNQISELDLFLTEQSGPLGQNGQEVRPRLIVSDQLFLNQVAGTVFTEADTKGTHSRLWASVEDPAGEILEIAMSRFGMVGEDRVNSIQSVMQNWSCRMSGCVHQKTATVFSEQITWP
jgi:hypothetical protein